MQRLVAVGLLLLLGISSTMALRPRTFGRGIPNHLFTDIEDEIFNHTLPASSASGMITHFWSTACGAGESFKEGIGSGRTIHRYYIDGESTASVVFTPREAAGIIFVPVGECNDPSCTHTASGGHSTPGNGTGTDEYVIGFPEPSGLDTASAKVPWGTEWIGKTSDMDRYYTNIGFRSIKVSG